MPFDFSYYAFICKLYKMDGKVQGKKKKGKSAIPQEQIIWSNPEEEIIDQVIKSHLLFFRGYLFLS